ncbi:hypothetical protein CDD83_6693 [Cordyceps sp. RAO-2017]|nr:hypothetical protein CDD83_6693 [Cordyceps sp. RAO-2017]
MSVPANATRGGGQGVTGTAAGKADHHDAKIPLSLQGLQGHLVFREDQLARSGLGIAELTMVLRDIVSQLIKGKIEPNDAEVAGILDFIKKAGCLKSHVNGFEKLARDESPDTKAPRFGQALRRVPSVVKVRVDDGAKPKEPPVSPKLAPFANNHAAESNHSGKDDRVKICYLPKAVPNSTGFDIETVPCRIEPPAPIVRYRPTEFKRSWHDMDFE